MRGTVKYIILVVTSFVVALIITHFRKDVQFYEVYTLEVALLALLRTCKEED